MQRSTWMSFGLVFAVAVSAAFFAAPRTMLAQQASTVDTTQKRVQKGNSRLITESEIANVLGEASDAYAVIEKVRPAMLRKRSTAKVGITVFQDDVRTGGPESLRSISSGQIKEIRYLPGPDATTRWGTGVEDGVIQVITKR